MRCSYCGRSNKRGALECSSCGAPLPISAIKAQTPAPKTAKELFADPEAKRRAKRRIVVILVIVWLIAALSIVVFFFAR